LQDVYPRGVWNLFRGVAHRAIISQQEPEARNKVVGQDKLKQNFEDAVPAKGKQLIPHTP